jgi:hypothetical protein
LRSPSRERSKVTEANLLIRFEAIRRTNVLEVVHLKVLNRRLLEFVEMRSDE